VTVKTARRCDAGRGQLQAAVLDESAGSAAVLAAHALVVESCWRDETGKAQGGEGFSANTACGWPLLGARKKKSNWGAPIAITTATGEAVPITPPKGRESEPRGCLFSGCCAGVQQGILQRGGTPSCRPFLRGRAYFAGAPSSVFFSL
jgi:hypothetical protein